MFIFRDEKDPVERALINLTTAQVEYSEDQQAMVKVPNTFRYISDNQWILSLISHLVKLKLMFSRIQIE